MGDRKPTPMNPTRLAGVGLELAATVGCACLLGYWIDRRFDVSPWGLVICALLGIVGGLYNLIRQAVHDLFPSRDEQGPDDREAPP